MSIPILHPEDAEYLARTLTNECAGPNISYAARVGIAAVILNRMEDDRYPDTAAAVLNAWNVTPTRLERPLDEKDYRLSLDACRAACDGADPTGGALSYEILEPNLTPESPYYTVVIDNVAFW